MSQVQTSSARFSIGLVNYKTLDLTKVCLTLLKQHIDSGALAADRVEVWVVDNDSKDDSTTYLRSLDWIHLIERPSPGKEQGFAAHGEGLDLILSAITTDYLFLMHTDTFIYDPAIFNECLLRMQSTPEIAAIGCLHQLNRGHFRLAWRTLTGFIKHYSRRLKLALGLPSRPPKPYIEPYIKSFFALWNAACIKRQGYRFYMAQQIPGYVLQDKLSADGYVIERIAPGRLFRYLDHVEAGTVGLVSGYTGKNRRLLRKQSLLQQLHRQQHEKSQ